jgi:hypothetical protein
MEEDFHVLISSVLRILDNHELPSAEAVAQAAEPFAGFLSSAVSPAGTPLPLTETRQGNNVEAMGKVQPLPPKDRAAIFSVEQRSYDSFLRALEEARKPLSTHALDLFQ